MSDLPRIPPGPAGPPAVSRTEAGGPGERLGRNADASRPVEYQGRMFNHARDQRPAGTPGAPARLRPAPRPGAQRRAMPGVQVGQTGDVDNRGAEAAEDTDPDKRRGQGRIDEADGGGGLDDGSQRQGTQLQRDDGAPPDKEPRARLVARSASQEVDALAFLGRSRLPGTEVLFDRHGNGAPVDRQQLMEAVAAVSLSVLRHPPRGSRCPSPTALMLAAAQVAMERLERSDVPPSTTASLLAVKQALLAASQRVPPAREAPSPELQSKYAVLPPLLLHLIHRPRTPGQHDRSSDVLSHLRRTREFCLPANLHRPKPG